MPQQLPNSQRIAAEQLGLSPPDWQPVLHAIIAGHEGRSITLLKAVTGLSNYEARAFLESNKAAILATVAEESAAKARRGCGHINGVRVASSSLC